MHMIGGSWRIVHVGFVKTKVRILAQFVSIWGLLRGGLKERKCIQNTYDIEKFEREKMYIKYI